MPAQHVDRPRYFLVGAGTGILTLGLAAAIMLLPPIMGLGLDISGSAETLGVTPEIARRASEASVQELFIGPGSFTFVVTPDGLPFYGPAEAAHMRDVRIVVLGFFGLVLASATVVVLASRGMRGSDVLRAVRRGAVALVLVFGTIGLALVIAFDPLFTLFHLIAFPSGGWQFDPTSQRIVQLYPTTFWEFAAGTLAVVSIAIGMLTIAVTTVQLRRSGAAGRLPR